MTQRQDRGIESDDDESQIQLSYTFVLHLMQLPGTFLRRSKPLGQVTFQAMELFEDEDSVGTHIPNALGMLNTSALNLVLSRIQQTAGFACSGFEYSPTVRSDSGAGPSRVMVSTWAELDKCLEFIEDTNQALDVYLVPVFAFVFLDEGEGSAEDFRLECDARSASWDWMSKEIRQITGNHFACSYASSERPAFSSVVYSQLLLDELLDHIFATCHNVVMAGTRQLARNDFLIRLRLVPHSSQVTLATVPAGLPGAAASSAGESRSSTHVDLACAFRQEKQSSVTEDRGGKADEVSESAPFLFGSIPVSAVETFAGAIENMQALVRKQINEHEKSAAAKQKLAPALVALPAQVRAGRSRVTAFIYRVALDGGRDGDEAKESQSAEEGKDASSRGGGREDSEEREDTDEDWAMEDADGLWGFKVDDEKSWRKFRVLLFRDDSLQKRAVSLVLVDCAKEASTPAEVEGGAVVQGKGAVDGIGNDAPGSRSLEVGADTGSDFSGEGVEVGIDSGKTREPLKQVVLMCYDGECEPIKMLLRPQISWRDVSTRVAKVFGSRSNMTRLCYRPDTSSQILYIESEQHLRKALHDVQRKWQLGAGDGVLHCAICAADGHKASTMGVQERGSAAAIPPNEGAQAEASTPVLTGRTLSQNSAIAEKRDSGRIRGLEAGLTRLHLAASANDVSRVRALVSGEGLQAGEAKVAVNSRDRNGSTALHYACSANAADVAALLIESMCDVNTADERGCAPLHVAASCDEDGFGGGTSQSVAVQTEMEREGAVHGDAEEREKKDREAMEERGGGIVKLLIAHNAKLNVRDSAGWSALHWAACVDQGAAAAALIKACADVDAPSSRGWTPLHVAARYGGSTVAGYLVRADADVLRPNSDGFRPMDLSGESRGRPVPQDLREATKRAIAIEHANKRHENTDIKTSEVSALAKGLVKLAQGEENDGERRRSKHSAENEVFRHFAHYDSDKDGSLSKEEFHLALEATPFKLPFTQREKLHRYMDVDGDGMIDVEEFATALFGRPPPALDKSYMSIVVEQIDVDTQMARAKMPRCELVRASVDFLSRHRSGLTEQKIVIQQGSPERPLKEGGITLQHQQRLCVNPLTHHQNRHHVLDAIMHNQEMLRAEIILYGQAPAGTGVGGGEGEIVELGGGVLCLAPEKSDSTSTSTRETRRVPIYPRIAKAEELPASWREASAYHLLSIIRRTPLSLQQKLKPGDRGGPPSRANMAQLLSDWEREARHARQAKATAGAADEPGAGGRSGRVREASYDPIAVAMVSVRATHVLDSLVVELIGHGGSGGGKGGIQALSDTWQARWSVK